MLIDDAIAADGLLVEHLSAFGFSETVIRVTSAIERAGLTVFGTVDHAVAAQAVGLTMPPTLVLTYGNARGGTPIMLASPRAALDLPLRVLLHERSDGRVVVAFHPVAPMLRSAGVPDTLTRRLEVAQAILVEALA
jgi:uncharacterized protein (DUF302 family)